jgi:NAD(P)-dependent dehydrogenase (short-subunit alcohol dehydrogenase family)
MGGLVIVTGGSRGIGAAVCRRVARDGYAVAVNYSSREDEAERVVGEIRAEGGTAASFRGDVANETDVETLFAAAQAELGPLAGLVNNAGILGGLTRFEDLTSEALRRTIEVNVIGTVLASRAAVRAMSTRRGGGGGAIVNLSSVAARIGGGGELIHYALTKGAIDTFTMGLGREVATEGIRVNAVAPGMVETEMNTAERLARIVASVPAQRAGTVEEIAEAVAWLISPAASYVLGTTLTVSGGR